MFFNTNYRTEMKLVPIIMDYCLRYTGFNVLIIENRNKSLTNSTQGLSNKKSSKAANYFIKEAS